MITRSPATDAGHRKLRADAERNRLRIIEAARELFAERGLDVTLDDVAAHAGVGVGTVYRRFANRDELIVGVLTEHLAQLTDAARGALDNPDPWEAVVDLLTLVASTMATDRGLAAIIVQIDHSHTDIEATKTDLTAQVQQVFDRAKDAGVLRPDLEPTDFFGVLIMLSAIGQKTEPVVPGAWQRFLQLILDGIRADGRDDLTVPALSDEQIQEIQRHKGVER
ncbi:TetR/AcrR family transcriptional regulator [Gordonia sp. NPDC003424]